MPTYTFTNSETGEQHEEFMKISEMEQYLEENPNMVLGISAPLIHSGRGMQKPDATFRDMLKHIKKGNQKGITRSTINTF